LGICRQRKDGALKWKYLVAPSQRLIVSNGQLESAWPVYGVALLGNKFITSASTHTAIGGGVSVALLDPATGQAAWRKTIHLPPNIVPPGGGRIQIIAHAFINSAPKVVDGQVTLGDGGSKGGSFTFDPNASEADLNKQLATPPAKKK
jgi:hypothetical protein